MQDATGGPGRDVLSREEARERARRVRRVDYELSVDLAEGGDSYTGRSVLTFELGDPDLPLALDFTGQVTKCLVNGREVAIEQRDHRIWLAPEHLDRNAQVVVEYRNVFDTSGEGLHRFVDPEDGEIYLYSNLEPFAAHRLFPCLDQPDIKGTYRLSVDAPSAWRVVSAATPTSVTRRSDGRALHEFPATPPFSTYLLPLIAGPFERLGRDHDGIALGLYGRRSMRRELERSASELFEVTGQGLDYFREFFDQPYPFTKYDQLFVPEFNAGAMENVAAVTVRDGYLFRDPPTWGQRLERAEIVLHELAHMWFGDLVTMRWWDDLWLNETFATYLSYRCLADATRFRDAWRVFNGQMRPAATRADRLVTTHPIAADVPDTDAAVGNFDAITYEKGAAVMKQLVAALGEDAFREGVRRYVRRHAWGNATLADFLEALGSAAGRSLDAWASAWLQTASLNTVGARWTAEGGRITAMHVEQSAVPEHPHLRPHALEVGLVHRAADANGLRISAIPVRLEGAGMPVPEAVGLPAPVFVFPNHADHDYALASLDATSLAFALEGLPELPDALLRQQVWSSLWEMTRDVSLPVAAFLAAVHRFMPLEVDSALVAATLDRAATALERYLPQASAGPESEALVRTAIEAMHVAPDSDLRITWTRAAISFASRPEEVKHLLGLLDGEWSIADVRLDQEMRWGLVARAVAHDLDGADTRLHDEIARDRSDRGARAALRALSGRPDRASKRTTWTRINGAGYGSDYLTRSAMSGFQWRHQRQLLEPYTDAFFDSVRPVFATRDHAFSRAYVRWLVPDLWAEPPVMDRILSLAQRLGAAEELLRRHLEEVADDLARAIRVQGAWRPL